VSGSADAIVRVWSTTDRRTILMSEIEGHKRTVMSVRFAPDGDRVVSGSLDHTMRVSKTTNPTFWESLIGRIRDPPIVHSMVYDMHETPSHILSMSISHNCLYMITGHIDKRVRIWNMIDERTVHRLRGDDMVTAVCFSPNDRLVAYGFMNGTVCIVDLRTVSEVCRLVGHSGVVYSVNFSPNGKRVVTGSSDATVRIWDVSTASEVRRLGHSHGVRSACFSPDDKRVASGSEDNMVRLWSVRTGKGRSIGSHRCYVTSVCFSPDGRRVVSGGNDKRVCIWSGVPNEVDDEDFVEEWWNENPPEWWSK